MLSHKRLWHAIDALAAREGVSTSSLARMAGLDASIFNRSKRFQPNGRPRWPSTESIARILDATHLSVEAFFVQLLCERRCVVWSYQDILDQKAAGDIPPLDHTALGQPRLGGHEIDALNGTTPHQSPDPEATAALMREALSPDERVFLLRIEEDRFKPFYKEGVTFLLGLCCPLAEGDRVIFFCPNAEKSDPIVGDISIDSKGAFSLVPLNQTEMALPVTDDNKVHIAKILWASQ